MSPRFLLALILTLLPTTLAWGNEETPELLAYRNKVLFKRIHHVLEIRVDALGACTRRTQDPRVDAFAKDLRATLDSATSQESDILRLMDLFQKSEAKDVKSACYSEIVREDSKLWRLERQRFTAFESPLIGSLVFQIDPHCALREDMEPDLKSGAVESIPCFAGDALVLKTLLAGPYSAYDELKDYAASVYSAVKDAANGASIDLSWADHTNLAKLGNPELFWAMTTFLMSAAPSNIGYIDGFSDYVWQQGLRFGHTPNETLAGYNMYRQYRDLFRDIMLWASAKNLHVMIGKNDVTGANHHNFIAAFLACHFKGLGEETIALALPAVLGNGYESLDFISHLKQGVSLAASIQNFQTDTARYREGTRWAFETCK